MKRVSRFTVIGMISTILLSVSTPVLSNTVFAAKTETNQKSLNNTQTFVVPTVSSSRNSLTQDDLSESISREGTVTYSKGVKTFEISDDALERAINKTYGNEFSVELAGKRRHSSGVTKIRYYGHGNINIYLSKSALNSIRGKGFKYGFSIVMGLIAAAVSVPSMGIATSVITSISSTLVSNMLNQVGRYKVGRVYKIRHWRYAGWRYQ